MPARLCRFLGGPAPNDGMFNLRGQSPIWCGMGNLVAFWRVLAKIRAIQFKAGLAAFFLEMMIEVKYSQAEHLLSEPGGVMSKLLELTHERLGWPAREDIMRPSI